MTETIPRNPLSQDEILTYKSEGFVVPQYRLPADDLVRLQALTQSLLENNPGLRDKGTPCPHFPQPWLRELGPSEAEAAQWLSYARNPAILDMVESIVGEDIVLWGTNVFHKGALQGPGTPWHRDSRMPIEPLATTTVWIAIFDSTVDNSCLRVIPGSHRERRTGAHHMVSDPGMIFESTVDPNEYDEGEAVDVELEAGQMVMFDVFLIHGARPNKGTRERAGYALRYMPGTSFYDHDTTEFTHAGQPTRPLLLVRGADRTGRNDLARNHQAPN